MPRVSNIRISSNLADFKCDDCGTVQTDVDVNGDLSYYENESGGKKSIVVPCTNPGCDRIGFYPVTGGGPLSQDLASAKTS